ncbi:MAG: hypothetical protein R3202_03830 [Candidatus Competibacterales bacterium]|nr:hypothetical protein [Candidatus Competibacterales bacterium]
MPIPTAYERSYQPKMWAAHHWNVLAADVAERLNVALSDLEPSQTLVLHVHRGSSTVFTGAFHELLETQLMQQGFGVTRTPAGADLMVEYTVNYAGRADKKVESGYTEVEPPDNDIVVNVSVLQGSRYITRISEIFYIDKTVRDEYMGKPKLPPTRLVEVVGR